jgi:hypothetical protein
VIYARSIAAKEISKLPKKQYKESADQRRAARRTDLQGMRNQRGQPERHGPEHDQAGPVNKRIGALVEAHRRGDNGDAGVQFPDESRIGFI